MKVKTEYQSVQMPKELVNAIRALIYEFPELGYRSYHEFIIGWVRTGYFKLFKYKYKDKKLKTVVEKNTK